MKADTNLYSYTERSSAFLHFCFIEVGSGCGETSAMKDDSSQIRKGVVKQKSEPQEHSP